jgi:FHA domain-containing protein
VHSVKELRSLVRNYTAPDFKKQLGPFALVQRPPDERVRRMAIQLGAQDTLASIQRRDPKALQELMFNFDDLVVATLPALTERHELMVGRLPDCDLMVEDPSVSKRHAVLRWDKVLRRCTVSDSESTNGTTVNGVGLAGPEMTLRDGDMVSFGNAAFCFLLTDTLYVRLLRPVAASPRS